MYYYCKEMSKKEFYILILVILLLFSILRYNEFIHPNYYWTNGEICYYAEWEIFTYKSKQVHCESISKEIKIYEGNPY